MGIRSGNTDDLNKAYGRADILIEDCVITNFNHEKYETPAAERLADRIINDGEDYDTVRNDYDESKKNADEYILEETKHDTNYEFLRKAIRHQSSK